MWDNGTYVKGRTEVRKLQGYFASTLGPKNDAMAETMKLEACRILLWSAIVANVKSQQVDISMLQPH